MSIQAVALEIVASKSLASRRQRPSQAKVRSTTHRRGGTVLASCAQPIGPTVQVLPALGKAFAAFEADERECSLHTNDIVRPMIERAAEAQLGTAAVGAVLGAVRGGAVGRGRGAVIGTAAGTLAGAGAGADQAAAAQARIQ